MTIMARVQQPHYGQYETAKQRRSVYIRTPASRAAQVVFASSRRMLMIWVRLTEL